AQRGRTGRALPLVQLGKAKGARPSGFKREAPEGGFRLRFGRVVQARVVGGPDVVIDRGVQGVHHALRFALRFSARVALDHHQLPFIRLVARLLLGPLRQFLAVRREYRAAVRGRRVLRQALPLLRAAGDGHPANLVVRAPRLGLLRHGGEDEVLAVRAEREVFARLERGRGREGVPVAGGNVLGLGGPRAGVGGGY